MRMGFSLEDGSEHTLEEIGHSFAVTRERIRQIEAKALRKLRAFMDGVRDYDKNQTSECRSGARAIAPFFARQSPSLNAVCHVRRGLRASSRALPLRLLSVHPRADRE